MTQEHSLGTHIFVMSNIKLYQERINTSPKINFYFISYPTLKDYHLRILCHVSSQPLVHPATKFTRLLLGSHQKWNNI